MGKAGRSRAQRPPVHQARNGLPASASSEPSAIARLQEAVARHQAGDLEAAAAGYRAVLARQPDQPDAMHLLGVVHHQKGDSATAVELIQAAIRINPGNAVCQINLGAALRALNRLDEAAECFEQAIRRLPESAESYANLAAVREAQHDGAAAFTALETAVRLNPSHSGYRRRLGSLLLDLGRPDQAVIVFDRLLGEDPNDAEARNNVGLAHERMGDFAAAETHYRGAIEANPGLAEPLGNLGNVHVALGRRDEAEATYRRAIALAPAMWRHRANLASFLAESGRLDEAKAEFATIAESLGNEGAEAWNDLGGRLGKARCYEQAEAAFRRAIELDPKLLDAYNNLGTIQTLTLRPSDAIDSYRGAVQIDPQYLPAQINLTLLLQREKRLDEAAIYAHGLRVLEGYDPTYCNSRLVQILRDVCDFDGIDEVEDIWTTAETFTRGEMAAILLTMLTLADEPEKVRRLVAYIRRIAAFDEAVATRFPLPPLPPGRGDGKIRLGFVSSDFRNHAIAVCMLPLFREYDRDRFEVFCYSAFPDVADSAQEQIKGLVDRFIVVDDLTDHALARTVRDDRVDVLFDLNGFTARTRASVFAHRMAPVQIAWLGWPASTGYREMDYFLLDRFNRPTGEDLLAEAPLELPGAWFCFGQVLDEPIVPPPQAQNGFTTFGTLNNTYKYSRRTIALWAEVMNAVEGSRFVFVRPECRSMVLVHNLIQEFGRHGIDAERLNFIDNHRGHTSYLSYYNLMDVTLDTFPVTGGNTTCDSLWMGVPVVSLCGPAYHQRISHSILNHVGLGELSCDTPDDYVRAAVGLVRDPVRLAQLRAELRQRLLDSDLCRTDRFVARFQDKMIELVERHGLR